MLAFCVLLTILNGILNVEGGLYCGETLFQDSLVASNGGISSLPSELNLDDRVDVRKSEIAKIPTMNGYDAASWTYPRNNCPHEWQGLTTWESKFGSQASGDVTISNGEKVIITACSLPSTHSFDQIVVEAGGMLIFDDSPITLYTGEIRIMGSTDGSLQGRLYIGSETCRLYSTIDITFTGEKSSSSTSNKDYTKASKGLVVDNGIADIHGKQYHPTWTRLARTVTTDSDIVYLQDAVNWEVGQKILITTSVFHDCPDEDLFDNMLRDFCPNCYEWQINYWDSSRFPECQEPAAHQNEIFTIKAISKSDLTIIQLDRTPTYQHFASSDYQVEVVLISRRITFWGERTTASLANGFGGHTIIKNEHAIGRIRGTRADFMGQLNVLGRYPFHMHFLGAGDNAKASYFQDNMVTDAQFRCYTIHATNSTLVTRNAAYNAYGMCYYLEDGVEEEVTLTYNLAAHVHPIKYAADGGKGQSGQEFVADYDLVVPADTSASGFYIPNAYNTFIGNAASGGWSGFAFPNTPKPLGEFWDQDWLIHNPEHRPTLIFDGNTAHSSGFYWSGQGAGIYVGAKLWHSSTGIMNYDSGRNNRQTYVFNTTDTAYMRFTNTKTFLTNKGISHWGDEIIITNFEAHDTLQSAQLFGEAAIYKALAVARTANEPGWSQQVWDYDSRHGFQFYDTHVKTILSHFTFRGFKDAGAYGVPDDHPDRALVYLDHSDQFLPQGINAVKALKFEDCDEVAILGLDHCGQLCKRNSDSYWNRETMSAKIYNVRDFDGSYSLSGKPSLMGSFPDWWDVADDCVYKTAWNVWYCEWRPSREIAFLDMKMEGYNDDCQDELIALFPPPWCNLQSGNCTCARTNQYTAYSTGYVSQWLGNTNGANKSVGLGGWPGVAGISNNAWYWRQSWWGAVDYFTIGETGDFMIPRGHFVILSIKYPQSATFTVELYSGWAKKSAGYLDMADSKATVLTKREDINDDVGNWKCGALWNQKDGESESFKGKVDWWRLCDFTNYGCGSVGPAWYFDQSTGYLYLRIVNLKCYSAGGRYDCLNNDVFEYDDVFIYKETNAYQYRVTATCQGCTVGGTWGGRTFWTVTDEINTEKFDATWNYETCSPSVKPTPMPTDEPTPSPVSAPITPTVAEPTGRPTAKPTGRPVATPTARPTAKPTARPTTAAPVPTPAPVSSPIDQSCPYMPYFVTQKWSSNWWLEISITDLCDKCGTITKVEAMDENPNHQDWMEGSKRSWGDWNYFWDSKDYGEFMGACSFRITNSLGKIITYDNILESPYGSNKLGYNPDGYGTEQFCAVTVSVNIKFTLNENSNKYWMAVQILLPTGNDDQIYTVAMQDSEHGDTWMKGTKASWGTSWYIFRWQDFVAEGDYIFFAGPLNFQIVTTSGTFEAMEVFSDITPNEVKSVSVESAFTEEDDAAAQGSIAAAIVAGVLCIICFAGWFIWYKRSDKRKARVSFAGTNETSGKTVEMNARMSKYSQGAVETPVSPATDAEAVDTELQTTGGNQAVVAADDSDEDEIEIVSPVSADVDADVDVDIEQTTADVDEEQVGKSYKVSNVDQGDENDENDEDYEYYYDEDENGDGQGGDEEYEYDETEQ